MQLQAQGRAHWGWLPPTEKAPSREKAEGAKATAIANKVPYIPPAPPWPDAGQVPPKAPPTATTAPPDSRALIASKSGGGAPPEVPKPIAAAADNKPVSSEGAWAKAAAEPAPKVKAEPAECRDLRSYRPPAKENNFFTEMFAERCDRFQKPLQQQVFRVPDDAHVDQRVLYIIRGARVPTGSWGAGFMLLLDGSGGSFTEFHAGNSKMPDEYQDYIVFIPELTNPMPGYGKGNKKSLI